MSKHVKMLCMIETAIAFNLSGKDALIDEPIFKECYKDLYEAVVKKTPPRDWDLINKQGKRLFSECVVSVVKKNKMLQEFDIRAMAGDAGNRLSAAAGNAQAKATDFANNATVGQGAGVGAGVGAGIGALGSAGVWAVKRLQLRKKLQACQGDPDCEARVNAEIKSLRNKALVGGAAATLGGAAIGGGMGAMGGGLSTMNRNMQAQQAAAAEAAKASEVNIAKVQADAAARQDALAKQMADTQKANEERAAAAQKRQDELMAANRKAEEDRLKAQQDAQYARSAAGQTDAAKQAAADAAAEQAKRTRSLINQQAQLSAERAQNQGILGGVRAAGDVASRVPGEVATMAGEAAKPIGDKAAEAGAVAGALPGAAKSAWGQFTGSLSQAAEEQRRINAGQ